MSFWCQVRSLDLSTRRLELVYYAAAVPSKIFVRLPSNVKGKRGWFQLLCQNFNYRVTPRTFDRDTCLHIDDVKMSFTYRWKEPETNNPFIYVHIFLDGKIVGNFLSRWIAGSWIEKKIKDSRSNTVDQK